MTPRPSADPAVGERIRARRMLRGWSIRHAASRAGVSHATWSRIERGRQATGNRFLLADIAAALECTSADLAGTDVPAPDRAAGAAQAGVAGVRSALIDIDLTDPPAGPAPLLAELAHTVALADARHQACDYAGVARLLPDLLRGLHTETAGPDHRVALRLLCDATHVASSVLRDLGHPADAWLAAERCRDAAAAAGDPVLRGYAAYALARSAIACGSDQRGQTIAERAIDELGRAGNRPGAPEVLGSLHLVAALAGRGRQRLDDSREWLAEAAGLARRTGQSPVMGLFFGPVNVDIWRMGIEVDDGDPGVVLQLARRTDPAAIPAGVRQVFYYADAARALTRTGGRDREAIRLLLTAERIAPQHVRTSAQIAPAVRTLLDRSHRRTGGSELRGLAERMRIG
ncbi:helix-turn-helix domain-containing protein [Actinoplanes sp. N902-109]|uniref:helix-turn-helix domain-containing protein n=1 Tax=Actinoplanes sp. (strain N902-109) TaxID=649831 RepID=UPI0003294EF9|nr:helix-turn-helix transcriptional regulator [Actinoplanes sp. N902-109]AGL15121.1 transcriptional regulator, XRE family [Actinoplanes sp. N902-109]